MTEEGAFFEWTYRRPGGDCFPAEVLPMAIVRPLTGSGSAGLVVDLIKRYGEARVPMDEALAQVTVDLSNRPFLHLEVELPPGGAGMDPQLLKEFWRAVSIHGGMTLHITVPYGDNTHHILEAIFKAAGRALDAATQPEPRATGVPSTKGVL